MPDKQTNGAVIGRLLGEAIDDPAFRQKLLTDPAQALKDKKMDQNAEAIAFFKSLSTKNFEDAAKTIKPTSKLFTGEAGLGEAEANA